jgi:hypothetical protein
MDVPTVEDVSRPGIFWRWVFGIEFLSSFLLSFPLRFLLLYYLMTKDEIECTRNV